MPYPRGVQTTANRVLTFQQGRNVLFTTLGYDHYELHNALNQQEKLSCAFWL